MNKGTKNQCPEREGEREREIDLVSEAGNLGSRDCADLGLLRNSVAEVYQLHCVLSTARHHKTAKRSYTQAGAHYYGSGRIKSFVSDQIVCL